MALYYVSEAMDELRSSIEYLAPNSDEQYTITILGVTGDLAKKKLMPTIWVLYRENLLPPNTQIVGFGRSPKTVADIRKLVDPFVGLKNEEEKARYETFWKQNHYVAASYTELDTALKTIEGTKKGNRLFYFSLLPSVYVSTAQSLHTSTVSKTGWNRYIIEKPFGRDSETSDDLSNQLIKIFKEDQIYRIDHYLGKEMVQNRFRIY